MTEAHPLRCETCDKPYCEGEETRFKFCPLAHHFVLMMWDGKYIPYTQTSQDIETLGCASHSSAKSDDAVLEVGVDYIIQKLQQEYDDGGYDPDLPLWGQVVADLKKLRQKER